MLKSVGETMLWTLYNRAVEAQKPDGIIKDDLCIKIYKSIDYDYPRSFGKPSFTHAYRSVSFDNQVRQWLQANPGAPVVELAAGLETQFFRINNLDVDWYAVDLPESIEFREQHVPGSPRLVNIPKSALDFSWLDDVKDTANGVGFFSMQGLLMYFHRKDVIALLQAIGSRYPRATLMFDTVPRWMSKMTLTEKGFNLTPHYKVPPIPWGTSAAELRKDLPEWLNRKVKVKSWTYRPTGILGHGIDLLSKTPLLNLTPTIHHVSSD